MNWTILMHMLALTGIAVFVWLIPPAVRFVLTEIHDARGVNDYHAMHDTPRELSDAEHDKRRAG